MDESCEYIFGNINSLQNSISTNIFGGINTQNPNLITSFMIAMAFIFFVAITSYQQSARSRLNLHEKTSKGEDRIDKDEF